MSRYLTTVQAAAKLRVSPSRVRQFVMEGLLFPVRKGIAGPGAGHLFDLESIMLMKKRRGRGRPWPRKNNSQEFLDFPLTI